MPRNLPWVVSAAAKSSSPASPGSQCPESMTTSRPLVKFSGHIPPQQTQDLRAARTPSASPPPPPPSEEEYMRPGLFADDAYIMVEDEFLATARTFTAHLHHAEYKRLEALARERKRLSALSPYQDLLDGDGQGGPSPPLLRKRKQTAGTIRARTRAAGKSPGITIGSAHVQPRSIRTVEPGKSGVQPESGARQADDPWLGTSLAPLLSPQKRQVTAHLAATSSLASARGVRSDTRAARGYMPAESAAAAGVQRDARSRDNKAPEHGKEAFNNGSIATVSGGDNEDTQSGDDDLDAPISARPTIKREQATARPRPVGLPSPPPRTEMLPSRFEEIAEQILQKPGIDWQPEPRLKPWLKKTL